MGLPAVKDARSRELRSSANTTIGGSRDKDANALTVPPWTVISQGRDHRDWCAH